jgi:hypothetical protein
MRCHTRLGPIATVRSLKIGFVGRLEQVYSPDKVVGPPIQTERFTTKPHHLQRTLTFRRLGLISDDVASASSDEFIAVL